MRNVLSQLSAVGFVLGVVLLTSSTIYADTIVVPAPDIYAEGVVYPGGIQTLGFAQGVYRDTQCRPLGIIGCESRSILLGYANGTGIIVASGKSDPGGLGSYTDGRVKFYVTVDKALSQPVPLKVTYFMSTSATSDSVGPDEGFGVADFTMKDNSGILRQSEACFTTPTITFPTGDCGHPSTIDTSFSTYLTPYAQFPNGLASITLYAEGDALGGSYAVEIDPMVTFAPGFDSSGLSLIFSPNPPGTTPEPGSLVLLGSGMTTVFYVVRHRRRSH